MNTLLLYEAICDKLLDFEVICRWLKADQTRMDTGQQNIPIHMGWPDTEPSYPAIVMTNPSNIPLVHFSSGNFRSMVYLYIVTQDQLQTTILADTVSAIFTRVPEGEIYNRWYCDLSNDCIHNHCTKWIDNEELRKGSTHGVNYESDTYQRLVILEIGWRNACGNCCEPEWPEACEPLVGPDFDPCLPCEDF